MTNTTSKISQSAEARRILEEEVTEAGLEFNTFKGYADADLRELFSNICDSDDWKAPLFVQNVERRYVGLFADAIRFMTGAPVKVEAQRGGMFDLSSVGYRNGPCGG